MSPPSPGVLPASGQAFFIARTPLENAKITYRKIADLIPFARNARTHDDAQVAQIAASIKEFGWTNPVLIDGDSGIIAGHGRVLAARKLGMKEAPCIELSHMTETQKRAYIIADNKLALNAGWDDDLLSIELAELSADGFDLSLTGFSDEEIEALGADLMQGDGDQQSSAGNLAAKFMLPPFSVLNAREGWWQDRKRSWLALGIKSEIGRGGESTQSPPTVTRNPDGTLNYGGTEGQSERFDGQRRGRKASPGGSPRPAADCSKKQRGSGSGRPING